MGRVEGVGSDGSKREWEVRSTTQGNERCRTPLRRGQNAIFDSTFLN